jgi:hypothetical protein
MPDAIPQPKPVELQAPPPPAPRAPSATAVVLASFSGAPELVAIHKRTYAWEPGRRPVPCDEQPPLDEVGIAHEPLGEGRAPSWRSLPETIGFKQWTDVVVQAHARPRQPVAEMRVAVELGERRHEALVLGRRTCESANGRIAFTPPAPFSELPLRYELAYGGRDAAYEAALLDELRRTMPAEKLRRAAPSAEGMFGQLHPLMYPRNRFGQGYVLHREAWAGRELPQIERPDDRLTPERLVAPHPLQWQGLPLPIGFDYLDPMSFPRMAMFACPPPGWQPGQRTREVELGLAPADLCRGNIALAKPEQLPGLVHPRCCAVASLGLTFPLLRGDETIALHGMDHAQPLLALQLPAERPRLAIAGLEAKPVTPAAELHLVLVDVDARRLSLVWAARHRGGYLPTPQQLPAVAANVAVTWSGR